MGWVPMHGGSWSVTAASFVAMWAAMMVVMMMPSLVPMLWRYRRAVEGTDEVGSLRLAHLTLQVGTAYFLVWTALGCALFPIGAVVVTSLARLPALARAAPLAVGVVVFLAGGLQLTRWKARQLACCREAPGPHRALPADAGTAWRHGIRIGLHCCACCVPETAILLVLGVMDLRAMAIAMAAITIERLAPTGESGKRLARAMGAVAVAAGMVLIAVAVGLT
jgi:predicted metal-binding membrane protein